MEKNNSGQSHDTPLNIYRFTELKNYIFWMTKQELTDRTKRFSVRIVNMVRSLDPDFATKVLLSQVIRSGTSVGANYRAAACIAKSEKDFINKLQIVEEELDETIFWLEILIDTGIIKKENFLN